MKKLLIIFLLIFTSSFLNSFLAQNSEVKYADKSYYLVDSLDLSQLGEADLTLLDSCLKVYHENSEVVNQINALQKVCNKMFSEQWVKFQFFQYDLINLKLEKDPSQIHYKFLQKSLSNALNNIGYIKINEGNIELAIYYYNKSLTILKELNNQKELASVYNNLGMVYKNQGNFKFAIEKYNLCLSISEKYNYEQLLAESINNLGEIYLIQNNYDLALTYFNKSLKINKSLNNKRGVAILNNNIGCLYLYQDMDSLASIYFNKSEKKLKEIGDQKKLAFTYNNLGKIEEKRNNFKLAETYYLKSLLIRKNINDKQGISNSYYKLGLINLKQNKIVLAQKNSKKGLELAIEIGYPNEIKENSFLLSKIAQKQGNYKEAFEMYQLQIQMRDSITNEKNYKAVIQQQSNYEYENKKAEDSIVNVQAKKVQLALLEAEKVKTEKKELALKTEKKQKWFLYIGLGILVLFSGYMYNRFMFIKKQRQLIKEQKIEVEKSHKEIEESHKEITDSINYAERIQRSFLATKETLDENLKDYFVFFKPKEAVSGDFYWSTKLENNNFAFTVADSTGHGVPGAIMSLLNITSLEKSVETETEPHFILNKTREIIIKRLKNDGSKHGGKDGMDCSLLVLNEDKSELTFASANNTVIIIRNKELLEYKGDKMPVGKHLNESDSFTLQKLQLQKGDVIYALTDGFQDQFGGPKGKKYMIKNLKNKFIEIANSPMKEQKEILSQEFNNWKGELEQIDDVCVIGVRV